MLVFMAIPFMSAKRMFSELYCLVVAHDFTGIRVGDSSKYRRSAIFEVMYTEGVFESFIQGDHTQ
jgi:hypothetical protein